MVVHQCDDAHVSEVVRFGTLQQRNTYFEISELREPLPTVWSFADL